MEVFKGMFREAIIIRTLKYGIRSKVRDEEKLRTTLGVIFNIL